MYAQQYLPESSAIIFCMRVCVCVFGVLVAAMAVCDDLFYEIVRETLDIGVPKTGLSQAAAIEKLTQEVFRNKCTAPSQNKCHKRIRQCRWSQNSHWAGCGNASWASGIESEDHVPLVFDRDRKQEHTCSCISIRVRIVQNITSEACAFVSVLVCFPYFHACSMSSYAPLDE